MQQHLNDPPVTTCNNIQNTHLYNLLKKKNDVTYYIFKYML